MEAFLTPGDGSDVSTTRNSTKLSRFCEQLVKTFLGYKAESATVAIEKTEWDMETLYKGLWNVCARKEFRSLVDAHRQDGQLMLVRRRQGRTK